MIEKNLAFNLNNLDKFKDETNKLAEQMKRMQLQLVENDVSIKRLEAQREENIATQKRLNNEIIHLEEQIREIKSKLITMNLIDEQEKQQWKIRNEATAYTYDKPLIENAMQLNYTANLIENKFGFKLKLVPANDDKNAMIWSCTYIFDPENDVSQKYIMINLNLLNNSLKLKNMKPKPKCFVRASRFFEQTQDITGLLYAFYQKNVIQKEEKDEWI